MDRPLRKVTFIINPGSGTGAVSRIEKAICRYLDTGKYQYELHYVQGPGHAFTLTNEAVNKGKNMVVAIGGDGTVNQVAKALCGTTLVMGIIPTGSGNGLARCLGIPVNIVKAIELLNEGTSSLIDTAAVNNEFFVSIAGVGFDAMVASEFERVSHRGFWSYLRIILTDYITYKCDNYKLDLNGEVFSGKAFLISIANSNQFGYNTTIAPEASLNDGLLDICMVSKPPWYKLPYITLLLLTNRINRSKSCTYHKAREIRIVQEQSMMVNIDGDPVIIDKDLHFTIKPLSLRVVCPKIQD